jgi:hypothetical protein
MCGLKPFLFLHTSGYCLFYVPFFRRHVVVDNKSVKLSRQ